MMILGAPARGSQARVAAGLTFLALIAGACTVSVEFDPNAGHDSVGVLDETVASALDPERDSAATGPPPEPPLIVTTPPPGATATDDAPTSAETPPSTEASPAEAVSAEASAVAPAGAAAGTTSTTTSPVEDLAEPGATETSPVSTTTTTSPTDGLAEPLDDDLPGDRYEYGPDAGTSLAVVGVDHDDVLNVRDVPFGEIIATLGLANPIAYLLEVRAMPSSEPVARFDSWTGAIVATGRTRKLPTTVWHEVEVAGITGWASGAYLAPIGLTDDVTARLIDRLGETPEAPTLTDLALTVGEAFASVEPPSRVVVTVGPIIFEGLGEVTVDVLNLGDDSLRGYRLHIFATPAAEDWMSEDPGPFTLRTVERSILCHSHRGVTPDGLCI